MRTFYRTALRLLLLTLLSAPMVGHAQRVAWAHKLEETDAAKDWYYLPSNQSQTALLLPDDRALTDNAASVTQRVVGPVLTASLTVDRDTLTLAQVAAGTPLTYTVRFQNVGTDTAFALSIRDSLLTAWLQMGTLSLLAASHNCQWALDSANQLRVGLGNTGLPDSATNRLTSKGFVRFRVTPRTTLAAGTRILNRAYLTCMGSVPVLTNEVVTLVLGAPSGLPHEPGASAFTLYPNPATESVTLTGTEVGATVTLFDALGRPVTTSHLAPLTSHLDVRGLPRGLYVVRIGHRTQRLVVE